MFGGFTFGGGYFAGLLEVTVVPPPPVAARHQGWDFSDGSTSMPGNLRIRSLRRDRRETIEEYLRRQRRMVSDDEEELMQIAALWLNSR